MNWWLLITWPLELGVWAWRKAVGVKMPNLKLGERPIYVSPAPYKIRAVWSHGGALYWTTYNNVTRNASYIMRDGHNIKRYPYETMGCPVEVGGRVHLAHEGDGRAVSVKESNLRDHANMPGFFGGCVCEYDKDACHIRTERGKKLAIYRVKDGKNVRDLNISGFALQYANGWLAVNDGVDNGLHNIDKHTRIMGNAHAVIEHEGNTYGAVNDVIMRLNKYGSADTVARLPVKEVQGLTSYKGVIMAVGCSSDGDFVFAVDPYRGEYATVHEWRGKQGTGSLFDMVLCKHSGALIVGRAKGDGEDASAELWRLA